MTESLVQFSLALCGLTANWWGMGNNARLRRWAPVLGLAGQSFWALFALTCQRRGVDVRGLWVIVVAFALVYARGILVQWWKVAR